MAWGCYRYLLPDGRTDEHWLATHTSFQGRLRRLGLLGNKHIPAAYLRAGYAQRLALLQGLMDTDGYVNEQGHCEITLKPRLGR